MVMLFHGPSYGRTWIWDGYEMAGKEMMTVMSTVIYVHRNVVTLNTLQ